MVGSPVSGFMPIPLAMMLPFMAAQSMLMGDAFGRSFQYGKRKISAMSNEDFNKYDEASLISDMTKTYEAILPSIKEQIDQSKDLQAFIVASLLDMPRDLLFKFFSSVAGDTGGEVPSEDLSHKFLSDVEKRTHVRHGHAQEIEEQYGPGPYGDNPAQDEDESFVPPSDEEKTVVEDFTVHPDYNKWNADLSYFVPYGVYEAEMQPRLLYYWLTQLRIARDALDAGKAYGDAGSTYNTVEKTLVFVDKLFRSLLNITGIWW